MSDVRSGLFITLEGIDGCGKSTQAKLLGSRLTSLGCAIEALRDPGGTAVSEEIRRILLSTDNHISPISELLLYEAARAQMVSEKIKPWLEEGKVVILDRFYDSTTAYQGYGRGIDLTQISRANQIASQGFVPDLTILIDMDWEVARSRRASNTDDRMEKEGRDFFDKIRRGYEMIAQNEPDRVRFYDGNQSVEALASQIWPAVEELISLRHLL